ncbi:hypothetical protein [Corynebacterium meridianum]|nr:hypothetical protein [Corynebacterium meridianum]
MENTYKVSGVDHSLLWPLIEYNKDTEEGRYGSLKGVIGVAK